MGRPARAAEKDSHRRCSRFWHPLQPHTNCASWPDHRADAQLRLRPQAASSEARTWRHRFQTAKSLPRAKGPRETEAIRCLRVVRASVGCLRIRRQLFSFFPFAGNYLQALGLVVGKLSPWVHVHACALRRKNPLRLTRAIERASVVRRGEVWLSRPP